MRRGYNLLIILVLIFMISGCATNRGYLNMIMPVAELTDPNGKQVYIRSIQDNRDFQDNPSSANIPSLGFGGLQNSSEEIRSRAIARKRNAFGKALGDILLKEGHTVETVIYESVKNSLYSLGYTVVSNKDEAEEDAIIMDITIDKYWAWFVPGFWVLSLEAEISTATNVIYPEKKEPIVINVSAINKCGAANTSNWEEVFKRVLQAYINKSKDEFRDRL